MSAIIGDGAGSSTGNHEDLPEGWVLARLEDICFPPQYGWTTSADQNSQGVRLLRTTDISAGVVDWSTVPGCREEPENLEKYLLSASDIVVSRAGSVGVSYLVKDCPKTIFASYLIRIRPLPQISSEFVGYFLQSPQYWETIAEESSGITIPNVNASKLKRIPIPLAPRAEQTRIVTKIGELLARVNATRERLAKVPGILKRFRQAVLAAATSGKLTEKWRGRLTNHATWKAMQLRDLSELITKGASPKWQGFSYVQPDEGILFITSENVREMRLDVAEPKYVESALNDAQKRSTLRKGDLLTNIVGASIGRTAIYDLSIPANINQAVCLVRLKAEVNGRFMLYMLSSPNVISYMHGEKVNVARANLSLEDIGDIPLNIPERDEQDEIVRRVEALLSYADRLEARFSSARAHVECLTPALLGKAFRGKLVPQDPSDEPAVVLLERIRALPAAAAKLPRSRKAKQSNKEVRELMQKLFDVLKAAKEWLPAEEAFRRCGVSDGSQTDRLEELYAELRQLDKVGTLQVRRIGDFDELRLEPKA